MHFLNTLVARAIPFVPHALVRKISRRYIAGDDLDVAIKRIRQLNAQGFSVTIDVLGEVVSTTQAVQHTVDEYLRVLESISTHALDATISVKPTALGLLIDSAQCMRWLEHLVQAASTHKTAVCIDMEDVSCTQNEINLFNMLRSRYANVSLALQAYLQRTYQDIEPLLGQQTSLRICKGIYVEERRHLVDGAWKDRTAINAHFLHHVDRCFASGTFVEIATHDAQLITQIVDLVKHRKVAVAGFEFQMLLGVCEPLRDSLLADGFKVRIYLPYGKDWYGYSTRRIKENPSIAGYILRALWQR
jgi:proline dehydrogenase